MTPYIDTTNFRQILADPQDIPAVGTSVDLSMLPKYDTEIKPSPFLQSVRLDFLNQVSQPKSTLASIANQSSEKSIYGDYQNIYDTHERLNSGDFLPKFQNYVSGVDNEARLSQYQTGWDKFINPVKKFGVKVGRGIPGDIAGFVYGVGEAIALGRAESIFDNSYSRFWDDLDKSTDFDYKNYYNQQQSKLGANMYTWDKFMGGAEFTARMIGAELLIGAATGGSSLPSSFAKAGLKAGVAGEKIGTRLSRALGQMWKTELDLAARVGTKTDDVITASRFGKGLESAAKRGKIGDALVTGRFAVTGSAYEAGFEARHYQDEAKANFLQYYRDKGIQPTQAEIDAFSDRLDGTGWGVFAANMAILSASNMALFGDMLNIPSVGKITGLGRFTEKAGEKLNSKLFGIGVETASDGVTRQAIKSNLAQKVAAYVSPFVKGALVEGVWEEGTQGIASSTFKNYVAGSYDKDAMKNTANYIDSFTKALVDQYTTKEGIEEIVIGGLVGGLFGGAFGGVQNVNREIKLQPKIAEFENAATKFNADFSKLAYTDQNLISLLSHASRSQSLSDATQKLAQQGDNLGASLKSYENLISMLQASHSVGKEGRFVDMLVASMQGQKLDPTGVSGLSPEALQEFKSTQIEAVKNIANSYSKALDVGRYLFGKDMSNPNGEINHQNLIDAFAYNYAMASATEKTAAGLYEQYQTKLAEMTTSKSLVEDVSAVEALKAATNQNREQYIAISGELNKVKSEYERAQSELEKINTLDSATINEADRVEKAKQFQALTDRLNVLTGERDLLWASISENFYKKIGGQSTIKQIDFDSISDIVADINEKLDNVTGDNVQKDELKSILSDFQRAHSIYLDFNKMANDLTDPELRYNTYRGLFAGTRARSDKSINDLTKDVLLDMNDQGVVSNLRAQDVLKENQSSDLSQDSVKSIQDGVTPLTSTEIEQIKSRLDAGIKLRTNEQALYDSFKNEIDNYVKPQVKPLKNTDTSLIDVDIKLDARRAELDALQQGDFKETRIESELDRINSEISNTTDKKTIKKLSEEAVALIESTSLKIQSEIDALEKQSDLDFRRQKLEHRIAMTRFKLLRNFARNGGSDVLQKLTANSTPDEISDMFDELESESNTLNKTQELINLEVELARLNEVPFDPNMTWDEQMQWMLDNMNLSELNDPESIRTVEQPSRKDLSEYRRLSRKSRLSPLESEKLTRIKSKLSKFNTVRGTVIEGVSLLDVVELVEQKSKLKEQSQSQKHRSTEAEMNNMASELRDSEDRSENTSPKVGLVYDGAYIERQNGADKLYHIRLGTILQGAVDKGIPIKIEVYSDEKRTDLTDVIVDVNDSNISELNALYDAKANIVVRLGDEIMLTKSKNSTAFTIQGQILDVIDSKAYAITGQPTSYVQLFSQNADGTWSRRKSDYDVRIGSILLPFDMVALNKIKPGDDVVLEYDPNDTYNRNLSKDERAELGNIYVKRNGKLVQILKTTRGKSANEGVWGDLGKLRASVIEAHDSGQMLKTKVTGSYLGLPNVQIGADGKVTENPVNKRKVVSYGYVNENGKLILEKQDINVYDPGYVEILAKNKVKTPVVAFKYGERTVVFPINVKPNGVDASIIMDTILNDDSISREKKIFQINSLMDQYGLLSKQTAIDSSTLDYGHVRDLLKSASVDIDITNFDELKSADSTIYVDMNDPFTASKLILDLTNPVATGKPKVTIKGKPKVATTVKIVSPKTAKIGRNNKC